MGRVVINGDGQSKDLCGWVGQRSIWIGKAEIYGMGPWCGG